MVRRRDYRLSLQPSSNSYPRDHQASPPITAARGGGQENPPPPGTTSDNDSNSSGSGGGYGGSFGSGRSEAAGMGGGGNGVGGAIAREITLEMSPCVPVHASCGFIIEREGVRGVGR